MNIHGNPIPGTRIHIRIELCKIYTAVCQIPAHCPSNIGESDENDILPLCEYEPEEWMEWVIKLRDLKTMLMKKLSRECPLPRAPSKGFRSFVSASQEEQTSDEIEREPSREKQEFDNDRNAHINDFTENQKSIMNSDFNKIIDATIFQQALSCIRCDIIADNNFNEATAKLFADFVDKSFVEGHKLRELLHRLLQSNKSTSKKLFLKKHALVKLLNGSDERFSCSKYQDLLASYLSRIENEMLPIPFLVKVGYSPLQQPGAMEKYEAKRTNPISATKNIAEESSKHICIEGPVQVKELCENLKTKRTDLQDYIQETGDPLEAAISISTIAVTRIKNEKAKQLASSKNLPRDKYYLRNHSNPYRSKCRGFYSTGNRMKRRYFTDEEDSAIIYGLKRFKDEVNVWSEIRAHYAIFSGQNGYGIRTSVQLKDRYRTLLKNRDKRLRIEDNGKFIEVFDLPHDDEPDSIKVLEES